MRNPLTKWSLQLKELYHGRCQFHLRYPCVGLGLQGCRSGFNATNTLRTSLFFQTCPPTFLGLKNWGDIQHLDRSEDTSPSKDPDQTVARDETIPQESNPTTLDALPLAWFDDSVRFATARDNRGEAEAFPFKTVTIALENFHRKAVSLHRFRFPKLNHHSSSVPLTKVTQSDLNRETRITVIAGHENNGVDQETLEKADHVVFIPQYGTISSLNVVTSIGIALYYFHLDQRGARDAQCTTVAGNTAFNEFLQAFAKDLPLRDVATSSIESSHGESGASRNPEEPSSQRQRIDPRPIHPSFYQLEHNDIMKHHDSTVREFIRHQKLVLKPTTVAPDEFRGELGVEPEPTEVTIRLSLVYENQYDQRNLGGLFRLANAFLADVHYIGRRRLNRQGAVGSYLYTEKTHYPTVEDFLDRNGVVGLADSPPPQGVLPIMLFLSCEQEFLFHTIADDSTALTTEQPTKGTSMSATHTEDDGSASLPEDIAAYERHWGTEISSNSGGDKSKLLFPDPQEKDLFLDDNDSAVTDHIRQLILRNPRFCRRSTKEVRLFILVPQEGRCPAAKLTQNSVQRIRLVHPEPQPSPGFPAHRGLPAQVATGITLERLFSLLLFRG